MYFSIFSIFAIVSIGQVFGHIYENRFEQDIAISALHLSQAAYCMTHNSNWDCITCDSSNKLDFVLEEHNELVIQGYNSVKILLDYHHKDMTAQRVLNSVEFKINYEEPHKPIGGQM